MVIALVDGRRLEFYKSTGKGSKRPGKWLPTRGLFRGADDIPLVLEKYDGHQDNFPDGVEVISEKIEEAEGRGDISFHSWDDRAYGYINGGMLKRNPPVVDLPNFR